MQAQTHLQQVTREQEAALARRLLEANALYQRSNDGNVAPEARDHARYQARQTLESVLAMAPEQPEALNLLGRIALDEGQWEQAKASLEQAYQANPESAQTLANLGYHALITDEASLAADYFDSALNRDGKFAAAFAGKAHALKQQGLFDRAYLHYRYLLDKGIEWPSVYAGMLECASHLDIHKADQALALDAIRLLRQESLPHQEISGFVTRLLRQQYSTDNLEGDWLLDTAVEDELMLLALEKTLLPDPQLEKLITKLRADLLREAMDAGELYESRQRLAMSLALYINRTGFSQFISEEESTVINELDAFLKVELANKPEIASIAGTLIIRSLYGALFHQSYAPQIGAWNLQDWPLGMQPLMAATFYHKAEEEAYKQAFEEKQEELVLDRADLPHAWPFWQNLSVQNSQPLQQEVASALGVDTQAWPETARILVIGAGSGQRAVELAWYFTDVEVVAVDEDLASLAHGDRIAREKGLENIVFWPYSLASRFINDGNQVQMVEIRQLPSDNLSHISVNTMAYRALSAGGVLHIHTGEHGSSRIDTAIRRLMARHRLEPTTASLRRLRRMILNNPDEENYQELLRDPDFYATAGCRKRWFFPENENQLHTLMESLGNEVDWKLLRARDTDGAELATTPVLNQLQAQTFGSNTQSLVGQGISLYFQRRR